MASVAATGVGPFLAGAMYELAGQNFTPILAVFAATGVPLAIASLFLRPPTRPTNAAA
jgi:cyanate permease